MQLLFIAIFHFDAQIYKTGFQVPGFQNLNIHNGQNANNYYMLLYPLNLDINFIFKQRSSAL